LILYDINVFITEAEELFNYLKQFSKLKYDGDGILLGYLYYSQIKISNDDVRSLKYLI